MWRYKKNGFKSVMEIIETFKIEYKNIIQLT